MAFFLTRKLRIFSVNNFNHCRRTTKDNSVLCVEYSLRGRKIHIVLYHFCTASHGTTICNEKGKQAIKCNSTWTYQSNCVAVKFIKASLSSLFDYQQEKIAGKTTIYFSKEHHLSYLNLLLKWINKTKHKRNSLLFK